MPQKRVVITGMGCISPIGNSVKSLWSNLLQGKSGINPITRFDVSEYATKIAGEVKEFDPTDYLSKRQSKRNDRFTHFAIAAADKAINSAELDLDTIPSERIGAILGTGVGGIETLTNQHEVLLNRGPRRVSPLLIPKMISDMAPGMLSIKYNLKGPNYTITSACASSAHAIGISANVIKNNSADIVISGGSESPITPIALAGFCSARSLSKRNDQPTQASRPFDEDRDGFVMSEGGGVLVLEELEHAKKRGAPIFAEVASTAANADAYNVTAPSPNGEGGYKVMKKTLRKANISPSDLDYINTHGTATNRGDVAEARAINRLLSGNNTAIINSSKSAFGHLLGAAGGLESIVCIKSILDSKVHPTQNLENIDPECEINIHRDGVKELNIDYALSNSFGFGGHNASVLFKKFNE